QSFHDALDSIRDYFGMLQIVVSYIDYSGDENHLPGRRYSAEDFIVVLMARIGACQAQRANSGLIEQRQERFQLNIVYMRTVPVSPTDVKPDSIGRNVDQRPIKRFDMKLDAIEEGLKRLIDEHDLPLQRQVGRVELKHV